jgi:hypothetical protein
MGILGMIALASMHAQAATPILWLSPNGNIEVAGKAVKARMTVGATRVRLSGGFAYDFNGTRGGILVADLPELRLTKSITVSLWINLRSYVNDGPGAQILFRGDDRCGVDPYTLVIHSDGTIHFGIQDGDDRGMSVGAEIPLNRWMHVLGSFNNETGELQLWVNHDRVAYSRTSRRPFANLDPAWAPGIGIGNVQNDAGPHNQPLNGIVADLRLYDQVYEPDAVDDSRSFWDNPPASKRNTVH